MKSFRRILRYLKPYAWRVRLNILFNILSVVFGIFSLLMLIPFLELLFAEKAAMQIVKPEFSLSADYFLEIFKFYFLEIMEKSGKETALIMVCAFIFFTTLAKNLFRYLSLYVIAPASNHLIYSLRKTVFNKILSLPIRFFSTSNKGDLMNRLTSDLNEVRESVVKIVAVFFKEPFMVIITLVFLFVLSLKLTLIVFLMLPFTILVIGRLGKKLKSVSRKSLDKMGQINSVVDEVLGSMRIIKVFTAENNRKEWFDGKNKSHYLLNVNIQRKLYLASPLMEVLSIIVVIAIIYFGGKLVLSGNDIAASEFITFIALFAQIINPAKSFSTAFFHLKKGDAALDRIEDVLNTTDSVEAEEPIKPFTFNDKISFDNILFGYDQTPVINGISLEIKKGKSLALVGPSGAGKSTLADLLPRFYDVSKGEIKIDDTNIRNIDTKNLRANIGMVTQDAILFNDTIKNNIAFAFPNAKDEDIIDAAKKANAHNFIMQMESGYDTEIGDRGHKLSGGERQRITIARALLRNPEILILDEATSALDSASEKLVQEALYRIMENRTSLVIAHRLSTIMHADEIIVLQKGVAVERGTHESLMNIPNGIYREMVTIQAFD